MNYGGCRLSIYEEKTKNMEPINVEIHIAIRSILRTRRAIPPLLIFSRRVDLNKMYLDRRCRF